MIVVDASAAAFALLDDGEARRLVSEEDLAVPHVAEVELVETLRGLVIRERTSDAKALRALEAWQHLGVRRYPTAAFVHRIWELRHNVSAYDGVYVALAEWLDCPLLTADARLVAASGPTCTFLTVKS